MDFTQVFLTHEDVFPGQPHDFAEFKRLLASISRTDAIFWCARLNILVSDSTKDVVKTQDACASVFWTAGEDIARANDSICKHGGIGRVILFFRAQLLELLSWVSLLCTDHDSDGVTFDDAETRRTFLRAALIASELWSTRVYGKGFTEAQPIDELRRSVLASIRLMSLESSPFQNPFLPLARGASLFVDRLRARVTDCDEVFRGVTGLSMDDYFSILAQIAADSLRVEVDGLRDPSKCGLFKTTAYGNAHEPIASIAKEFFKHESQTAEELRSAIWGGDRRTAEETDERTSVLKVLRDRPIFRAADGRAIILDPRTFIERGSAGPLFHLLRAPGRKPLFWFTKFGHIFEEYALGTLGRMYPDHPMLVRRFIPRPKGRDERGIAVDLNDGILLGSSSDVLIEVKGVWLPDEIASADVDPESYLDRIRGRYGIATNPEAGERAVKGVGQLARTIRNLANGTWTFADLPMKEPRRLLPLLVVHDVHVDAPVHSHVLAQEFAACLEVDAIKTRWAEMEFGSLRVAHLIVMTVDELELLETSSQNFGLVDCLEEYARACPDRLTSLHNFLATSAYRSKMRENTWLAERCLELLDRCKSRLWPDAPNGDALASSENRFG